MRDIPQIYYDFIGRVEGNPLVAMQDSGGKWTIGKGHTGPEVRAGMQITLEESDHLCEADSHIALKRLYDAAPEPALDGLLDHEFSALLSFVFNLGADAKWTIWQDIKTNDLADVPTQLVRFDKIVKDGVVTTVPGLLHRRVAEVTLWDTPDVEAAGKIIDAAPVAPPSSAVTRDAVTPPAPAMPLKSPAQSKTRWAGLAVAALGLASLASTTVPQAQAIVDQALPGVAWLPQFNHLAALAVTGLGVVIVIIRAADEQLKTQ